MCFASKSSGNTQPPPPEKPTTFDYNVRSSSPGQGAADRAAAAAVAPKVIGSTFGSELGSTPTTGM